MVMMADYKIKQGAYVKNMMSWSYRSFPSTDKDYRGVSF